MEPGVQKGRRSLLACQTHYKCSMETIRNSVKVIIGNKVIQLVESLIGWEVTVTDQWSECHLTFVEGDFILLHKVPIFIIKLPEWRFQSFHEVSLFGVAYYKVAFLRIKHWWIRGASPGVSYKLKGKSHRPAKMEIYYPGTEIWW